MYDNTDHGSKNKGKGYCGQRRLEYKKTAPNSYFRYASLKVLRHGPPMQSDYVNFSMHSVIPTRNNEPSAKFFSTVSGPVSLLPS